ncbi:MAG TPA: arginase [Longimicrobiales bacterium]|nr:arginase [Longimicrobiales bacterium]
MEVDIIGVPLDFGTDKRGVDLGPDAIRYAGLHSRIRQLGHTAKDRGDVIVAVRDELDAGDPRLRYLDPILDVQKQLMERVRESVSSGRMPVVLGGDHSVGLGSIAGVAAAFGSDRVGVIWVDTHGDFNVPETTPSGNIHGMPLAALCGYGNDRLTSLDLDGVRGFVDPVNVVVVGARELDDGERQLMKEAGISVFSMAAIDRLGIHEVMREAIRVASDGTRGVHLSFDLDVIDPQFAPGVGTPAPGGLTVREAHVVMELVSATGRLVGLDVVEVNPILDVMNRTGELAVDLILSALGKRVWFSDGRL